MNPNAVDRIVAYRLGFRQVRSEIRLYFVTQQKQGGDSELLRTFCASLLASFPEQYQCFLSEMLLFLSVLFPHVLPGCLSRSVKGTGVAANLSKAVVSMTSLGSNCLCFPSFIQRRDRNPAEAERK